jgi:hypothetical protein
METNDFYLRLQQELVKPLLHSRLPGSFLMQDGIIEMQKDQRPRVLFLADRNILADQAYNSFSAFAEDALVRIRPGKVKYVWINIFYYFSDLYDRYR